MADISIAAEDAKLARRLMLQSAREDFWTFQRLVYPEISPNTFVDAWHLRAVSWCLQEIADGGRARQLITAPPRHFKSYVTSVAYPAFLLGRNPATKIICASYNEDLALNFAQQSRDILKSEIYRQVFPETRLATSTPAAFNLRTTQGGYRYATSVGGTLTGLGADVLIVDDPIKTDMAGSLAIRETAHTWLKSAALTRFDNQKRSVAIVTHQRQHMDDMIGRLKAQGGWNALDLPAEAPGARSFRIGRGKLREVDGGDILFPERFDANTLNAIREENGEYDYAAQYLQDPSAPGGGLFPFKKIKRFDLPDKVNKANYEAIILSIDPGVSTDPTADFTGVTAWAIDGPRAMLVGAWQQRWDMPGQIEFALRLAPKVSAILIELSHSGISLSQMLHKEGVQTLVGFKPKVDKQVRAQTAAVAIGRGRVWFPKDAPWLHMVEQQMAAFPFAKNDDLVDSMSQLFCKLETGFPHWLELSSYKSDVPVMNVTWVGKKPRPWI